MRSVYNLGLLSIGLLIASAGQARAQRAGEMAPPQAVREEPSGGMSPFVGGLIGAGTGVGVGLTILGVILATTEEDSNGTMYTDSYGETRTEGASRQRAWLIFLGTPALIGSVVVGAVIGVTLASDARERRERRALQKPRLMPVVAVSPNGGYLGAHVPF